MVWEMRHPREGVGMDTERGDSVRRWEIRGGEKTRIGYDVAAETTSGRYLRRRGVLGMMGGGLVGCYVASGHAVGTGEVGELRGGA